MTPLQCQDCPPPSFYYEIILITDQEGFSEVCEPWQEDWMTGLTVECKGSPQQIRKMFNFLTPPPPQTDCLASIDCPAIRVKGAETDKCFGEYRAVNHTTTFAPNKPLYSHVLRDRYIYWDPTEIRWEIGTDIQSLSTEIYATHGGRNPLVCLPYFELCRLQRYL